MKRCIIFFLIPWLAVVAPRWAEAGENELARLLRATSLWQDGQALHERGDYEQAAALYRRSIAIQPTAEAHTYLAWSLSYLDRLREAIAECKKAIAVDPDFGNPYNDVGVYLIQLGRSAEAVPWLEKAIRAKRYCCPQFAHFNLGKIHLSAGRVERAEGLFRRALEIDPTYLPALIGLLTVREKAGQAL